MPELPDIELYRAALEKRIVGRTLKRIRIRNPFLLRSVDPPISAAEGRRVEATARIGKRIVVHLEGDHHLVLHLMIAGRLRWSDRRPGDPAPKVPGRIGLAALDFSSGTLIVTEAGSKRRAWLRLVRGEEALRDLDPGGLEVGGADAAAFGAALRRRNHTLKRALTDPRILSGIGNAYSDEILHRAGQSPFRQTGKLTDEEIESLRVATSAVLDEWTRRLVDETGDRFPTGVTAFRDGMAVHGRFGQPCPRCGSPVQRLIYADKEANYCPTCQTGGRLLADRGMSRLLRQDWPRTLEELEDRRDRLSAPFRPADEEDES